MAGIVPTTGQTLIGTATPTTAGIDRASRWITGERGQTLVGAATRTLAISGVNGEAGRQRTGAGIMRRPAGKSLVWSARIWNWNQIKRLWRHISVWFLEVSDACHHSQKRARRQFSLNAAPSTMMVLAIRATLLPCGAAPRRALPRQGLPNRARPCLAPRQETNAGARSYPRPGAGP